MKIETQCLHEGYRPRNGDPRVLPIYQSTTYTYDSTDHIGQLFDLKAPGHMYSRISNPTVECVEKKIAALEGGVGALMTASGQAANMFAVLNIMEAGDHIIASSAVYGGTFNLFGITLKKYGIDCTFVDQELPIDELQKYVTKRTKAVFAETIANPAITVLEIEKFAAFAHQNSIPLIIDNTFATPVLCRPFEFGADIVTHSTTKYMDGHAVQIGGVVVDSGNFNWDSGKFPCMTEVDESYHGVVYTRDFGKSAYITKARVQLMRDMGATPTAMAAFLLNLGLETLPLRIERHCRNAEKVALYLEKCPKVEFVHYPRLESSAYFERSKKYLPLGTSGVIGFSIKGGRENAIRFMDSLVLASNVVHVADIRTCVLHPASATHRQMTDEQLAAAGITPGLIRLSVGLENIDDILDDISQAMDNV